MRDYEELMNSLKNCVYIPCDGTQKEKCLAGREDDCRRELMAIAANAIEELSKPRWIPVTERLPEKNGRYLVRYKRDIVLDYTEVHDDEVRIMRFFVGTGWRYPFLCQPELRAAEQQTVTHWMPLPEPPKEDDE